MYLADAVGTTRLLDAWHVSAGTLARTDGALASGITATESPAQAMMATQMGGQLGVLSRELQNTQTTIDQLTTVLGAYHAFGTVLDQLDQLAVQASTPAPAAETVALSDHVTALLQQLTAMTQTVTVNGQTVFAPAFTQTRMGSTAPHVTSITLDHYDQAAMAWTPDQGTRPMPNVLLRAAIVGTGFPQPSVMAGDNGSIDVRIPQYFLYDPSSNQFRVTGGSSYDTQAFLHNWTSTTIQTDGFGGGYGQTTSGSLSGPPPYQEVYAGQRLTMVLYNEALTASTAITFRLPPIRPNGTSSLISDAAGERPGGPTWQITAGHSTAFAVGNLRIPLPLDTSMSPLSLTTLTRFAAQWNGFDAAKSSSLTPSVAAALHHAVMADLGTLGTWESTVGGVLGQAQSVIQNLQTAQVQLTASQATLQDVNIGTATQTLARTQLLSRTSLHLLVQTRAMTQAVATTLGQITTHAIPSSTLP